MEMLQTVILSSQFHILAWLEILYGIFLILILVGLFSHFIHTKWERLCLQKNINSNEAFGCVLIYESIYLKECGKPWVNDKPGKHNS